MSTDRARRVVACMRAAPPPGLVPAAVQLVGTGGVFWSRPFYSARELAPLWPLLCRVCGAPRAGRAGPATLARLLEDARLPKLRRADGLLFEWRGRAEEYFVVSCFHRLREPVAQAQFEKWMREHAPSIET